MQLKHNKQKDGGGMILKAKLTDAPVVAGLAIKIWDNNSIEELSLEFESFIKRENSEVFVCEINGSIVGFAQCGLRCDYVEGTHTSPVGYLEGIYVDPCFRHNGYGRQLLLACENWAKDQGCNEFASDCELSNIDSFKFHVSVGFEEANRIVCFKKDI